VESRIADAICQNNQLLKVGLRFEFTEVMDRVAAHLIKWVKSLVLSKWLFECRNIDRLRRERIKKDGKTDKMEWKPARMLDMDEEEGEENEEEEAKE